MQDTTKAYRAHAPSPTGRRWSGRSCFHLLSLCVLGLGLVSCAGLPNRDPLMIDVAGIEPLPGEGMELNLAVRVRVQNPNDVAVNYTGAALALDLNGRNLASGVTDRIGTVPRYGEAVFTIPVTISAFDMARQVFGFMNAENPGNVRYRVRGKLEGGIFGTRRFRDEGEFNLDTLEGRPGSNGGQPITLP